ncbi:hypothetical protein KKD70_02150 [Patescibacteria group bacterium]|nr:hypothetical protein [Patescibacteria group bacterium]
MANNQDSTFGSNIIYYCKDCDKIVDAKRVGRKYVFKCSVCGTKNVAFGTEKSIRAFFHIEKDDIAINKVVEVEKKEEKEEQIKG